MGASTVNVTNGGTGTSAERANGNSGAAMNRAYSFNLWSHRKKSKGEMGQGIRGVNAVVAWFRDRRRAPKESRKRYQKQVDLTPAYADDNGTQFSI